MFPHALSLGRMGDPTAPERVFGHFVTSNYFAVLGVRAAAGALRSRRRRGAGCESGRCAEPPVLARSAQHAIKKNDVSLVVESREYRLRPVSWWAQHNDRTRTQRLGVGGTEEPSYRRARAEDGEVVHRDGFREDALRCCRIPIRPRLNA